MNKLNLYFSLISYILSKFNSLGQNYIPSTPCPNIYQYVSPGYGELTVPSPQIGDMLLLQIEFIMYGSLISRDVGSLNLSRSQQETLQLIVNGAPTIHYVLRFPTIPYSDNPPQIIRISYNGDVICSGPSDNTTPGPRSTIKLQNLLYSQRMFMVNRNPTNNVNNNIYNRPNVYYPTNDDSNEFTFYQQPLPNSADPQTNTFQYTSPQRPIIIQQQPQQEQRQPQPKPMQPTSNQIDYQPQRRQPSQPLPTPPSTVRDEDVCGIPDSRFRTNPLVYGGEHIMHGTWPWLAIVYVAKAQSLNFQCGGSLVSNRVVVSAAHCFVTGGSTISNTKVNIHLGRHNLERFEEQGHQRREVSLIKVHDDYMRDDSGSFDSDIAVVVLKLIVEYSVYVKPICLWTGNTELREIENRDGTVVGWGLTETGAEPEPKTIDIPIVSQEVCLRQSVDSFKRITSDRTFCAGSRNGTGPCNGDSGSSLALKQNNRWALRGIVSVSAATDTVHRKCDLSQFVVFTDAAQFGSFIKEYINLSN